MLGLDIQDDGDGRVQEEEGIRVFAGLGHEGVVVAHEDIGADGRVNGADGDCGLV